MATLYYNATVMCSTLAETSACPLRPRMKTQRLKDSKSSRMLELVAEPGPELRPNLTISNRLLSNAEMKENSQGRKKKKPSPNPDISRKYLIKQSGSSMTGDLPFLSLHPTCPGMA